MKQKFCWVARETRTGWRLKVCIGPNDYLLSGFLAKNPDEVKKLLKGNIVFVHVAKQKNRRSHEKQVKIRDM